MRNKYGVYFGLNVAGRYFQLFSRMGRQARLPGWSHEVHVIGSSCVTGEELAANLDEIIRDLERLKKWAIRYGNSETYDTETLKEIHNWKAANGPGSRVRQ